MDYKWDLGKFPMGNQDLDLFWFLLLVFAALSLVCHCFNADGNGRKMLSCRCCSSSPGRCRFGCFPKAQKAPALPTALWAHGEPAQARRLCPLHLHLRWLCTTSSWFHEELF